MSEEDLVGVNIKSPIIEVEHSSLTRLDDDSRYKSDCPICHYGLLPVRRDLDTFEIEEMDYCHLCGQRFRYLDVDKLRSYDGM